MLILNDGKGNSFETAITQLRDSHSLKIACSYLQPQGWEIIRSIFSKQILQRSKLIFTDQLSITNPAAVRMAMNDGVATRVFRGNATYHPKCYLSVSSDGTPLRYVLGSANISLSALRAGVEVGVGGNEPSHLRELSVWFDEVCERHSIAVNAAVLGEMEGIWKLAAASRAKNRLKMVVTTTGPEVSGSPADLAETYEDAFESLVKPIGMLNFDHAGNNVRTLQLAREALDNWPSADGKTVSEMKLLGFVSDGTLTSLGKAAKNTSTHEDLALAWCGWLLDTPDEVLSELNARLVAAKRSFLRFCSLSEEVSDFFVANALESSEKKLLQTIELICNASSMVEKLGLAEIRVLSKLLPASEYMSPASAEAITTYFANKGARGWSRDDRRIMVNAFRRALSAR